MIALRLLVPALICSIYATTYASSLTDIVVPEVGSTDFENPVVEMEAMQVVGSNADLHHASADAQQADTNIPESAVIKTEALLTLPCNDPFSPGGSCGPGCCKAASGSIGSAADYNSAKGPWSITEIPHVAPEECFRFKGANGQIQWCWSKKYYVQDGGWFDGTWKSCKPSGDWTSYGSGQTLPETCGSPCEQFASHACPIFKW